MQNALPPREPSAPGTTDRRVHPRVNRDELAVVPIVRIPQRPAVTLVDLSTGGTLLDLPFPLRPETRVTLEIVAPAEVLPVPVRLLRCTTIAPLPAARYRAAWLFERKLELVPLFARTLVKKEGRLRFMLEVHLGASAAGPVRNGSPDFDPLLAWMLEAMRRGERLDVIRSELRCRLAALFPSLRIEQATRPPLADPARGARFFGIDFTTTRPLSAAERRVLKAAAQFFAADTNSR